MNSRATRGCKAFTLALSLPSTRQVLNWMCRRVFRYNFVLSCKCTCSGQDECPRLKGNGTREQLLHMCREQLLHTERRAFLGWTRRGCEA